MSELTALKCKTCGNKLDLTTATDGVVECPYCYNKWTVAKKESDPAVLQFLRMGEHDLDTAKFDDAFAAYSKAAELDSSEPEAYFGKALAKFKVQYLKDEVNNRMQPICHAVTTDKFSDDPDYMRAYMKATTAQRAEYEKRAKDIDYIQSEFSKLEKSGIDYDCFICVKVTDETTKLRTSDYKTADDIYFALRLRNYKPFLSERELEGVAGADYEARILFALNKSKCMLVVCSDENYLQTKWVKNEYTRFLKLVNDEEKESDSIAVAFKGKPIERLPGKNGKLQGIDLNAIDAFNKVEAFVERHTPESRARAEAAKAKAEEEQQDRIKNLEEQIRRLTSNLSGTQPEPVLKKSEPWLAADYPTLDNYDKAEFEIDGTILKKYNGNKTVIKIPRGVTSIGINACCNTSLCNSIIIPDSVISIDMYAFGSCTGLTSITIPDSVTYIGMYAFSHCTRLTSITIPDSVTFIDDEAFKGCTSLESVTIGNGVTSIGHDAFRDCTSLTNITIGDEVTSIGYFAFFNTAYYNSSNNWTYGVLYIGKYLIIATEETLSKIYKIKDGTKVIADRAFEGCGNLTEIIIPDSVTSIGEEAFAGCESLTNIVIPDSVTSIGGDAFEGCTSLTSIIIPDSVTHIGEYAFSNTAYYDNIDNWVDDVLYIGKYLIAVADDLNGIYKIKNGTKIIADGAFYKCENLTEVIIPNSVTSIGEEAFSGCESLTNIVIPDSVESIGEDAFEDCTSLTSIIIPNSVTSIGDSAFSNCTDLTIYCRAGKKPDGWNEDWDADYDSWKRRGEIRVVWGYKG